MKQIILLTHNLRSCHNVGSLFRTAEGLGIQKIWLTGYTPYPLSANDIRLPHESRKATEKIRKTALGAEIMIDWDHEDDVHAVIARLKKEGYTVAALEQAPNSVNLHGFKTPDKVVLIVGRETDGIEEDVLASCDVIVEIPMRGQKESFNVVQAAAMALYHFSAS